MKIDGKTGIWAVYGGALLGGGGGGEIQEGLRILELALSQTSAIPVYSLSTIDEQAVILTASLVGSPASPQRYVAPEHYQRVYELFQQQFPQAIGGLITNEMGAQSSTNGWVLAAMTGLPLVDAPCNGRAHPTGLMGSLGLAEEQGYRSVQTAAGGRGRRQIELYAEGSLEATSALVRTAADQAGGFVTVLRNPVTARYVKKHAAVGALAESIRIGGMLYQGLGNLATVLEVLGGIGFEVVQRGVISQTNLVTDGGFDRGSLLIAGDGPPVEVRFWNEFMTADCAGARLATFPDLIALLASDSGLPLTSAAVRERQEVVLVRLAREHLRLGSSMGNRRLYAVAEKHLQKDLIKYVF